MNGKKERLFVSIGEAARLTGLDIQTVRKMADQASFICYRTPSNQRRINLSSIQEMCSTSLSNKEKSTIQKENFIYARVSSKKQMDDLSRQVEFLRKPEYSSFRIITDIASGINFKRKGLSIILDSCLQGCIGEVVVAHRDRLCRFGFDLIDQLVTKGGGKITVLNDCKNKSCEQELADDHLSIIHVFSCRQMGKRSYASCKSKNIENKDISKSKSKEVDLHIY